MTNIFKFSSKTFIDLEKKQVIKRFNNSYKMKRYMKILEYLNTVNFPVNKIIEVDSANNIIKLEYIEGKMLSEVFYKMEDKEKQRIFNNLAELIYKLHNLAKAKISVPFYVYIMKKYKKILDALKTKDKIAYRFSKQLLSTINSQITTLSLVHGDLNLKNILVDDNNNIIGILDWECSCYLDPLYDLAIFESFNLSIPKKERMYFVKKYLDLANISYSYYHALKIPYQYLRLIDSIGKNINEDIIKKVISMIETYRNINILEFYK